MEDPKCLIYTLVEMGLSPLLCVDWSLANVVNSGGLVRPNELAWVGNLVQMHGNLACFTEETSGYEAFDTCQV